MRKLQLGKLNKIKFEVKMVVLTGNESICADLIMTDIVYKVG